MAEESFPFDEGPGSVSYEDRWRRMARTWRNGVVASSAANPLNCSAGSGRQVIVSAGDSWVDGAYYSNTSNLTLTADANTSSNPVRYMVVLRHDPANNAVNAAIIKGSPGPSPAAPTPSRIKNGIYELPLFEFTMPPSAQPQNAASFSDVRKWSGDTVTLTGSQLTWGNAGTSEFQVTNSVSFTDPFDGDPYLVELHTDFGIAVPANTDGYGFFYALHRFDGTNIGVRPLRKHYNMLLTRFELWWPQYDRRSVTDRSTHTVAAVTQIGKNGGAILQGSETKVTLTRLARA